METHLTGRQFEQILVKRHDEYLKARQAHIGRYGVQGIHTGEGWMPIKSLPDFEGLVPSLASQIVFDAKVCSQASFDLNPFRSVPGKKGSKRKQLEHMYARDQFGATCFFLIHWNERKLTKTVVPPQTYLFPVSQDSQFWQRFEYAETKRLSIQHCQDFGLKVEWNLLGKSRTPRPDWLAALTEVAHV